MRACYLFSICSCILPLFCNATETVQVSLSDATYQDGVLHTVKGGTISTEDWKVRAQELYYQKTNDKEIFWTDKDILLEHQGRYFVGKGFYYDVQAQRGEMIQGVTQFQDLFLGAQKITFQADEQVSADKLYATTNDTAPFDWSVQAKHADLKPNKQLDAKDIQLNLYRTPVFWTPTIKPYLKKSNRPKSGSSIQATYEKGKGPLLYGRYRLLATDTTDIYGRLEYSLQRGGSGAVETYFQSPTKAHTWTNRAFCSYGTFYNNKHAEEYAKRYRYQGICKGKFASTNVEYNAQYDKVSDKYVGADFPINDSELKTKGYTACTVTRTVDPFLLSFYTNPRLQTFQGFKQELPTVTLSYKPQNTLGFITENRCKLSFLEYSYADHLKEIAQDFGSARCEIDNSVLYPLHVYPFSISAQAGHRGILYSDSPTNREAVQSILYSDCDIRTTLYQNLPNHVINCTPYLQVTFLSPLFYPQSSTYIFSHEDAFNNLSQACYGCNWNLYPKQDTPKDPLFTCRLFGYSFWNAETIPTGCERLFFQTEYNSNYSKLTAQAVYNPRLQQLHRLDCGLHVTQNEHNAYSLILYYHSDKDWKKCLYRDFLLETTREQKDLLDSPLSKERFGAASKWQYRLYPLWYLQIQNQIGWGGGEQPFYHDTTVELNTLIWNNWKVGVICRKSPKGTEFSYRMEFLPAF